MTNNQTIKERLFQYIAYKGISARSFSTKCGFSANYATNISKGIPEDKMNIISVHFPDLNPSWLMTGEGTMLRFDATSDSYEGEDAAKSLKEENDKLNEENEELRRRIERLEKMVDHLLEGGKMISKSCV